MAFPPMPPSAGPPMGAPPPPLPPPAKPPPDANTPNLPITAAEVGEWWGRIEKDRERRQKERDRWRTLLKGYLPAYTQATDYEDINSNIHFRNAHLKIAEVWAQPPELALTPLAPLEGIVDPATGQPLSSDHVVAIKRAVLTKLLGRDGANVGLTVKEALFDIFATSGIGATKIWYEADIQPVPDEPPPEQPGSILGLNAPPPPVPVVVNERIRWDRFSTEKLLIPSDWHSTDYDKAPYLGMEFAERCTAATLKKYHLPPDYKPTATRDELLMDGGDNDPAKGTAQILKGVEVWLRAADFDPMQANRDVYYRLVVIEGRKEEAAIYTLSPFQTLGPDGRLTPDSMIGNPIHPFVLRVCSDQAWIPSDACFTNPLVNIENTWMKQDTQLRDANIPRFLYADSLKTALDKIRDAGVGQGVGVPDDAMQMIDRLIKELPHLERAQSDASGRQALKEAINSTLGISPNQSGGYQQGTPSATEVATVQANISVRLKDEQNELMSVYLRGVRKFDTLAQRYLDQQDYITIIGAEGAQQLVQYDARHLQGRYAYDAHPDSQLTIDQQSRIKRVTDYVNFLAKSPWISQGDMARLVTQEFGFDASRLVKPPNPPPPPEIALSLSLDAATLAENLMLPDVRQILISHGIQIAPVAGPEVALLAAQHAQANAQPHGGGAAKADLVDKHHSDLTGHQVGTPPLAGPPAPHVPGHLVQ